MNKLKACYFSIALAIFMQACGEDPVVRPDGDLGLSQTSSSFEVYFSSCSKGEESSSSRTESSSSESMSSVVLSSSALVWSSAMSASSSSAQSSVQTVLSSSTKFSSSSLFLSSSETSSSVASSSSRQAHSSSVEPFSSSSAAFVFNDRYLVGADISKVQEHESRGVKFYDTDGKEKDIFAILRNHGFNAIRLKTFVSPQTQYGYAAKGCGQDTEAFGDKDHVVAYAQRVKAAGMFFLLDIHYSDNWADPGKQIIPERWRRINNSNEMADSVYAYTYDLVNALKQAGAMPDMVQVGNEITNGLLRDVPKSNTDCWGNNVNTADASVSGILSNDAGRANTAKYLTAGVRAVKAVSSKIKTSFHIENPEKTQTINWWMDLIFKKYGVTADAFGISAYAAYNDGDPFSWKSLFVDLGRTYTNLEFFIAEYNGAEKDNSYSFNGSRTKTQKIMEDVPRGLGAFFWEPTESGAWGSSLFDWNGQNALKANPRAFEEYDNAGIKKK